VKERRRESRGREMESPNSTSPEAQTPVAKGDALAMDAIAGDRRALSDLLRFTRDLALRHALARTQDLDNSEDIAQEVLVRVLESLHSFRFQSRFSSWVYRITENQIQTQVRSRARVDRNKERAHRRPDDPRLEPHPEVSLDAKRLWVTVNTVVAGLPELQGHVFRLVDLQQLEPCEAAQALGKSPANVRSSLCRVRVKIRERLLERAPALVRDLGYAQPHWAA